MDDMIKAGLMITLGTANSHIDKAIGHAHNDHVKTALQNVKVAISAAITALAAS